MDNNIVLQVRNIEKSFPGVKALDKINFAVKREPCTLLRRKRCWKSTLMKIINGIYRPDSGEVLVKGQVVDITSAMQARKLGISMINQELNFVPEMTVAENFFLGKGQPLPAADWRGGR